MAALEAFADWLPGRAAGADEGRDPAWGARLWEAKLWHTLDTELTAADVLRRPGTTSSGSAPRSGRPRPRCWAGDRTTTRCWPRSTGWPTSTPTTTTIVALAEHRCGRRPTSSATTSSSRSSTIRCVIQEMPEFARGVAVAYCDSPGPLEAAAVPTFYCIAPTPADWSPERVESFYREYNNHMVAT